jgi:HEPN domain-containing protein
MSAELFIANTLRIAAEDLRGAKLLRAAHNRNSAYLCEQAAEKLIRAILTSEGKRAGISHNLEQFVDLVPDENPLKPRLRELERLGDYATTYRYATPYSIKATPPEDVLDDLFAKIDALLGETASHFGVDLAKGGAPARSAKPLR